MRIRNALRMFDWKGWLGWVAATMVGLQLVVITIFFAFGNSLDRYWWTELATASVAGISLGLCQWIWLRRRLAGGGWRVVDPLDFIRLGSSLAPRKTF